MTDSKINGSAIGFKFVVKLLINVLDFWSPEMLGIFKGCLMESSSSRSCLYLTLVFAISRSSLNYKVLFLCPDLLVVVYWAIV